MTANDPSRFYLLGDNCTERVGKRDTVDRGRVRIEMEIGVSRERAPGLLESLICTANIDEYRQFMEGKIEDIPFWLEVEVAQSLVIVSEIATIFFTLLALRGQGSGNDTSINPVCYHCSKCMRIRMSRLGKRRRGGVRVGVKPSSITLVDGSAMLHPSARIAHCSLLCEGAVWEIIGWRRYGIRRRFGRVPRQMPNFLKQLVRGRLRRWMGAWMVMKVLGHRETLLVSCSDLYLHCLKLEQAMVLDIL
ncbi:hypothetical protein CPC08DRAFT_471484 [Agrocybe pediades]|nr:hypothetical protein CPC08DRAFT_471484 [Agrocybe pediades]